MRKMFNPLRAETVQDMRVRRDNMTMASQWGEIHEAWEQMLAKLVSASYHPRLDPEFFDGRLKQLADSILLLSPRFDNCVFVHDGRDRGCE